MQEEYEVTYNIKYCNEPYWQMGVKEVVTVTADTKTKGASHQLAEDAVRLGLHADRICNYKIVRVTYC
jgi:hypothetical protein